MSEGLGGVRSFQRALAIHQEQEARGEFCRFGSNIYK